MRELPILFSTEMVRAIRDGRKTMTRRIAKAGKECKYKVGDRPYVRERFRERWGMLMVYSEMDDDYVYDWVQEVEYRDGERQRCFEDTDRLIEWGEWSKWKPSIHMPKKIARIWLEVTDTRREYLKDISVEDILSEGIEAEGEYWEVTGGGTPYAENWIDEDGTREHFRELWDSIHPKEENKYDSNPEVDVIEFKVLEGAE